jgi:hypothetical protein
MINPDGLTDTEWLRKRLNAVVSEAAALEHDLQDACEHIRYLRSKLTKIVESRRCTDGNCIWGHPGGGMHTNGGCQSLKLDRTQATRELYRLAAELRALLDAESISNAM